ncbi:MAG: FIST N-terminal domain-containing protein [Microthrixaceae bacterium]
MHLAATISEHPVVAHAVGECVGEILERRGDSPDLLVLCISERLQGATEDIAAATRALLSPEVLLGVTSSTMSVGQRSSHHIPALAMLAVWHARPSRSSGQPAIEPDWQVRSERMAAVRLTDESDVAKMAGRTGTLLLFADPFSTQPGSLVERIHEVAPDLFVMAASSDSARRPSMSLMVLDDSLHSDGAVGVHFPGEFPHRVLCSFGFTPIGAKLRLGANDGSRIHELDGHAAKDVLEKAIEGLAPAERAAASSGLYLRWSAQVNPGPDVPRFCAVLGTDGDSVVFAGERPADATAVQFHVRDAESVDAGLRRMAVANSDLPGGLFLVAQRPERSGARPVTQEAWPVTHDRPVTQGSDSQGSDSQEHPGTRLFAGPSVDDPIREDAAILGEEIARSDLLGIRCGEVILADRGGVVAANSAVTILGLVD